MTISVVRAGAQTTVQDWPGRLGYWQIGVPPSGPMDDVSFRLANIAVGNPEGAPALEATLAGPALRFAAARWVCVTGAPVTLTVDGVVWSARTWRSASWNARTWRADLWAARTWRSELWAARTWRGDGWA